MKKRFFLTLLGLLLVVVGLAGVKGLQISALIASAQDFKAPALIVTAVEVTAESWDRQLHTVGAFEAIEGVIVSADLPGRITAINFTAGTLVAAGDILVRQDTSSEQAQLREAEAAVALAVLDLERSRKLLTTNAGSQADVDSDLAALQQAEARVDGIGATIAKKTIRAPFAGHLGIRQVNLGQNLSDGDPIVSLQTSDPMYVNFILPQQHFSQVSVGLPVQVLTDAVLVNGQPQPLYGNITTINPEVDTSTRNLTLQATLPNPDGVVLPGMSCTVAVILPQPDQVLVVPVTAVLNEAYGDSVFIIEGSEPTQTVRQQFVRLGRTFGDYVAIESGLEQGQLVVSAGVFKLHNGESVTIDNSLQPDFDLQPVPENR